MPSFNPHNIALLAGLVIGAPAHAASIDYFKAISPVVAGTYGGKCTVGPRQESTKEVMTLTPEGRAIAPGVDFSFRNSILLIGRSNYKNELKGEFIAANDTNTRDRLHLNARAGEDSAAFIQLESKGDNDGGGIMCDPTRTMPTITGTSYYRLFQHLFDAPKRTLLCKAFVTGETAPMQFSLVDGIAKLGEHTFNLDKLTAEHIIADPEELSYTYVAPQFGGLKMVLDSQGKLIKLHTGTLKNATYNCQAEAAL